MRVYILGEVTCGEEFSITGVFYNLSEAITCYKEYGGELTGVNIGYPMDQNYLATIDNGLSEKAVQKEKVRKESELS